MTVSSSDFFSSTRVRASLHLSIRLCCRCCGSSQALCRRGAVTAATLSTRILARSEAAGGAVLPSEVGGRAVVLTADCVTVPLRDEDGPFIIRILC